MYIKKLKLIKNQGFCGSVYKGCLLLIFLVAVMVLFVVAMLKYRNNMNMEKIPKRHTYMSITKNSIPFCQADPPTRFHVKNIPLT